MPHKTGVFCSCSQALMLAERPMNNRARSAGNIFGRTKARRVVALAAYARMLALQPCPRRETKDDHSRKVIVCRRRGGICRGYRDLTGASPDRAGMQREVPGGQERRHARRPEVE